METKLKLNLIFFQLEFNITKILYELRALLKFNIFFLPVMAGAILPRIMLLEDN